MFDIGWGELLVIGIVALVAIGPKELPTVMRTVGQWMGKVRRMASEFQGQFQEAMREAEVADLKKHADELRSAVTDATSFDALAESDKTSEPADEPAEPNDAEPSVADASAPADEPLKIATPEAEALPAIEVPPPEPPDSVTEKDFAPVEPPPKQAGGKA
jgi:sec-independent protein translocase protein TatB